MNDDNLLLIYIQRRAGYTTMYFHLIIVLVLHSLFFNINTIIFFIQIVPHFYCTALDFTALESTELHPVCTVMHYTGHYTGLHNILQCNTVYYRVVQTSTVQYSDEASQWRLHPSSPPLWKALNCSPVCTVMHYTGHYT